MQTIRALPYRIFVDADQMAHEIGSIKASNMVMLGSAMPFLNFSEELLAQGIKTIFQSKGEQVIELNVKAMQMGNEHAKACMAEMKKEFHP